MLVVLFDIDGTLISTGGAGLESLRAALREEFQVGEPRDVPVSGRTDRGIARQLFLSHGIEDSEVHWERFREAYLRALADWLPRKAGRVLPGVNEMLGALAQREATLVGLLTGNVRAGAQLKLGHYGLVHHFPFGGFGDLHEHRNGVAEEALAESRARAQANGRAPRDVWVIGDTPLDIQCARSIGARCVAVGTGSFSVDELAAHQPDLALPDLSRWQDVFGMLEVHSA